ncbi:hypothetical protein GGR56DRAFT_440989 [Xylariaceae sp. FL0804]|nr:hypothetical protein GGR56DRAFT_440989 [Xylariaceae sp. FL0804]
MSHRFNLRSRPQAPSYPSPQSESESSEWCQETDDITSSVSYALKRKASMISGVGDATIDDSKVADAPMAEGAKRGCTQWQERAFADFMARSSKIDQSPIQAGAKATAATLAKARLEELHASKPESFGYPPAISHVRGALCDSQDNFKSHQGGLHSEDLVAKGLLLDAFPDIRDHFGSQVVIASAGGGRETNPQTGKMERKRDYIVGRGEKSLARARHCQQPIAVIAGKANPLWAVKPKAYYNMLDFFHVTDMWHELSINESGDACTVFRVRLERIDLHTRSWWSPEGPEDPNMFMPDDHAPNKQTCGTCLKEFKGIYSEGWTCLNRHCEDFFKTFKSVPGINLNKLTYSQGFLKERTWFPGTAPMPPLVPALPDSSKVNNGEKFGTELEFKRGIICPQCNTCSRRIEWGGWNCENPECGFTHVVPMRQVPISHIERETETAMQRRSGQKAQVHADIKVISEFQAEFQVKTFYLPAEQGSEDGFVGSVTIFRPHNKTKKKAGSFNDMFLSLQEAANTGEVDLRRNASRCRGSRMEELTSHFACNIGAPYKYGVVVETMKGFQDAPRVVLESLDKLTQAGKDAVQIATEGANSHQLALNKTSAPDVFCPFNELLTLGYFEGSHISYHDDGEKELGPTVATLSLGSPAIMAFRPKKKARIGNLEEIQQVKKGGAQRSAMLSFTVQHGDIVIMHGSQIHRLYEHKVDPAGLLRFALTSRYIRPETIADLARRERALVDGAIPDDWKSRRPQGEDMEMQQASINSTSDQSADAEKSTNKDEAPRAESPLIKSDAQGIAESERELATGDAIASIEDGPQGSPDPANVLATAGVQGEELAAAQSNLQQLRTRCELRQQSMEKYITRA